MTLAASLAVCVLASAAVLGASAGEALRPAPWVIGHRGFPGKFPEHTRGSYLGAIDGGADFVECDITITADRELICRHEPLLSGTTDADKVFPHKRNTYVIDGVTVTGVFSVDLTLAEVKQLRAYQALATPFIPIDLRTTQYNGLYKVPTLREYLKIVRDANRTVGIYPETKHPTWTNALPFMNAQGFKFEDLVLDVLKEFGYGGALYTRQWKRQPCFIQSFEVNNLKYLKTKTDLPLIQLLGDFSGSFPDTGVSVRDAVTDAGLAAIAQYADGIGPSKDALRNSSDAGLPPNQMGTSTGVTARAHSHGLLVHPYTFRGEDVYLADIYSTDMFLEFDMFFRAEKMDGVFTDQAPTLRRYLDWVERQPIYIRQPYEVAVGPVPKKGLPTDRPYVIAHRGSCGDLPEETAEGYQLAIDQGADIIECDVVLSKDRKLVCRHEPNFSVTTDADKKFPHLIKTYVIDGAVSTGVHSVDLTLAQIRTLRTYQQRDYRNQEFNYQFGLVTLEEYIEIAQSADRVVGIYPETKNPTWFASLKRFRGFSFEQELVRVLGRYGYGGAIGTPQWNANPVFIQSFEFQNIKTLSTLTDSPLILLIDEIAPDSNLTNLELTTDAKLDEIAQYCAGVGPWKDFIVHTNDDGTLAPPTDLVARIHARGMQVHPYTFRNEAQFLAYPYFADPRNEYDVFFKQQLIDGAFTDESASLVNYFREAADKGYKWPQA